MSSKKNVIVAGGGCSGAQMAKSLSASLDHSQYNLILISSRPFFQHLPGTLRMLTSKRGALEDRCLIPYDHLLPQGKGTFKQSTVTEVIPPSSGKSGKVVLSNGENLDFEVLILATGRKFEGGIALPTELAQAKEVINEWRHKIETSKGVVIVGGGAVGSEFAGEVRDVFPDKPITIVHKHHLLLNDPYPEKFRQGVNHRWIIRNIHLVMNDEIDEIPAFPATNIVTKNGTRLEGDLVIPARGATPNTTFLTSLGKDALTAAGYIKVDPTLQVTGHPGIFAMGDIIQWGEVKQAAKYAGHVKTITPNVLSHLQGKPMTANYKSMFEGIALTNGALGGASWLDLLWGLSFGNWFTKILKSSHLFIDANRKILGYTN